MRRTTLALALALAGCDDRGTLHEVEIPVLELTLDTPTYGQFTGPGPMVVSGTVLPSDADLWIEDERVDVAEDGSFSVSLPYDRPYRILDVHAEAYEQEQTLRLPAFAGSDPLESWPGAIPLRLTETGLDGLSFLLEGVIDGFLTEEALLQQLPEIGGNGFTLEITGFSASPSTVELLPGDDGLTAAIGVGMVRLDVIARTQIGGFPIEAPGSLTLPLVGVRLPIDVSTDADGALTLDLGEPEVAFDPPEIELFGADLGWLSSLIGNNVDLGALITDQLSGALDGQDALPLGEPLAFETDLLGTTLAIELTRVDTDADGVALILGVGLDGPVPDAASRVPVPLGDFDPPADLAVGLHDGLVQLLLDSDLLDLLEQDIQLPGLAGTFLTPLLRNLPGGTQLPDNNGFCIGINTGDAKVARFGRAADDALAGIYLPVAPVTFGYVPPGTSGPCEPWLSTELALEVYLDVTEGTQVGIDIAVAEGLVLEYGADIDESEYDELVGRLGGVIESLLGLLGGFTQFDLADILGGAGGDTGGLGGIPLDGLEIGLRSPRPLGESDDPLDGMVELGVDLFGESPVE